MAIIKKPYELSVWSEALKGEGQKEESRKFIIGAHDMTYLGRASAIKLKTKLNGTHELTFQMPTKYFDSEKGDYVYNKFIDEVFAERKIKLHYKNEWFEFFVKQVKEDKKLKSILKTFTCQDAFIDELSRNGYGITFDEELYNNVEEIGTFTEEILEDSIWYYEPKNNWGDFTEYLEEKLYKIPISWFNTLNCYKLNFTTNSPTKITNAFTGEQRDLEMGDDQARVEKLFWDQKGGINKLKATPITLPDNDGYIYVPYSCLDFCYCSTNSSSSFDIAATEEPYLIDDKYALSPPSVDPNYLIQFYSVPAGAELEIDEAGLILDKNYIYFMTLDQWNKNVHNNNNSPDYWYIFKEKEIKNIDNVSVSRTIKKVITNPTDRQKSMGNKIISYDGYLTEWNTTDIVKGKKIQISDRSEINISEEIDQYVTIYNNLPNSYEGMYTNEEWEFNSNTDNKYTVCSKIATRQIIPQLARNFVQNGTNIQSDDGWEVMGLAPDENILSAKIQHGFLLENGDAKKGYILYSPPRFEAATIWKDGNKICYQKGDWIFSQYQTSEAVQIYYNFGIAENADHIHGDEIKAFKRANSDFKSTSEKFYVYPSNKNITIQYFTQGSSTSPTYSYSLDSIEGKDYLYSFINFGAVSQEKTLQKDKVYCLGLSMQSVNYANINIKIGEGQLISNERYTLDKSSIITIPCTLFNFTACDARKIASLENGETKTINDFSGVDTAKYIFIKPQKTIENPYIVIESKESCLIFDLELFEVYTKGKDQFLNANYQYSGRDYILLNSTLTTINNARISNVYSKDSIVNEILFEDDIMLGDTYEYQQYFIQRLKTKGDESETYDTMGKNKFISSNEADFVEYELPLDGAQYTEDDYEIQTNYIDLNNCEYFKINQEKDCKYFGTGKETVCMYQMYGYCPYRFQTEKHCRAIRTLKGEKSNRFNLTQELSKVFECYPIYKIEHDSIGRVKEIERNEKTIMDKRIFFIKEKGNEDLHGFRYHKNLSDIGRTIKSDKIVTKLYVQDVDSDISRTGLCSIKTAEDNPSKDSFIIDFSYYTAKGMLDEETVNKDLYGTTYTQNELNGYLKTLGFYNTEYDKLSNQIINLENASFTELEANLKVNLDGIETAQKQLRKYKEQMDKYKGKTEKNTTYYSYQSKYREQQQILNQLVIDTFQTNKMYDSRYYAAQTPQAEILRKALIDPSKKPLPGGQAPAKWISFFDINKIREYWLNEHVYRYGIMGQYNQEYLQIQGWKKERASYLKKINEISSLFFKKYEPFLKEGTWNDSNYLTDNAYYHGALEVAAQGAIPNVQYTIKVVDLSPLPYFKNYEINIADTSFIEDEELFGANQKTGLPNKFKIIISEINEELDEPSKNSITVQNFTTQFEDLFKQVTASVQSLQFNENIYKRSSNFTSLQNVSEASLQGTLDSNNLTLLSTSEKNIELDANGQRGSDINNHANQYNLNGQGLQFSNNGGESWNVGVGPNGINADYIKVGTLDAGKIRIVDSGYVYFSWDKEGIAAYRDPQNATTNDGNINDYALFNKYGLSIIRSNKIKLRAGYEYNGDSTGEISAEKDTGTNVGFYIYDNRGNAIFEAEDDEGLSDNDDMSARLRLRGEIFATDTLNNDKSQKGTTGVYLNNRSVHGTVEGSKVDGLRLFTAAYQREAGQVQNVFTILRNSVYIGGNVYEDMGNAQSVPVNSIANMPNSIEVHDPFVQIHVEENLENSTFLMDFGKLKDIHTKKSLVDYVVGQSYKINATDTSELNTPNWSGTAYSENQHNYVSYASSTVTADNFNDLVDKVADLYRLIYNKFLPISKDISPN